MLHVVSQTHYLFDQQALKALLTKGDAILFIQNGVYNAILPLFLDTLSGSCSVNYYVLHEDALARGITHLIDKRIKLLNYGEFVDLTVDYMPQLLW